MGGDTGDTHNDDKTHLGIPSVTSCSQGAGTFPGQSQADPQRGTIPAWGRGAEEVWSPRPGGGGGEPCLGSTQLYALAVWGRGQPPPPTPQGGGISCLMALDGSFFQELAAESFLILISFFFFLFLSSCKHSLALGHGGCKWGGGAALGRA